MRFLRDQGHRQSVTVSKGHRRKRGQVLTKMTEPSFGTEKQGPDTCLPRSCNGMNLRCRFLLGWLCKCHLTLLSYTVTCTGRTFCVLFSNLFYLIAFCSSSICSLTCCSSFSSSRSVPFTQVYTTSIGMGRQSLGQTHKSSSS